MNYDLYSVFVVGVLIGFLYLGLIIRTGLRSLTLAVEHVARIIESVDDVDAYNDAVDKYNEDVAISNGDDAVSKPEVQA